MTFATMPAAYATSINLARQYSNDADRKKVKKELFACLKETFQISANIKLKCETKDTTSPDYLILKNAADNSKFLLDARGKWNGISELPAAPQARWFLVDSQEGLASLAYDEFDDGLVDKPAGVDFKYADYAAVSDNGDVYVQLTEDQLSDLQ